MLRTSDVVVGKPSFLTANASRYFFSWGRHGDAVLRDVLKGIVGQASTKAS
jgi:hypothetical protein